MALWTPAQLGSSVLLWLDASNSASITQGGGTVSSWASVSPGTVTVAQATGTKQPAYSATSFNSKPGITFDGAATFLATSGTLAPPGTWTFISVATAGNNAASNVLMDQDNGVGGQRAYEFMATTSSTALRAIVFNTVPNSFIPTGTYVSATPIILASESAGSGGNVQLTTNGGTPNAVAITGTLPSTATAINVGSHLGTGSFWLGIVGEIVLVSGTPSTTTRQLLEGYIAWKWGLQSLLPSTHPWALEAPFLATSPPANIYLRTGLTPTSNILLADPTKFPMSSLSPAMARALAAITTGAGLTALSASSLAASVGKATATVVAPLKALSPAMAQAKAAMTPKALVSAVSSAQAKAKAAFSKLALAIQASSAAQAKAQAAFSKLALAVQALSPSQAKAKASIAASAVLAALSFAQAKAKAAFNTPFALALQAKSAAQAKATALMSAVSNFVSVSAASLAAAKGLAAMTVKMPLSARSAAESVGRVTASAKALLSALSPSQAKATLSFAGRTTIAALSAARSTAHNLATVSMPLLARSSAQAIGGALTKASLALTALSAGMGNGKATTALRTSLAALSKAISTARALPGIISPSVSLFARSASMATGRFFSGLFFPLAPGRLLGELVARARILGANSARARTLTGQPLPDTLGATLPRVRITGATTPRLRIIAIPSRAHGGATMWVQKDFDVSDVGEQEPYGFDYTNILATGEKIASVVWSIAVVSGIDLSPSSHLSGSPTISQSGFITQQFIVGLLPGVTYRLQALVTTTLGNVLSQFAHVTCQTPV